MKADKLCCSDSVRPADVKSSRAFSKRPLPNSSASVSVRGLCIHGGASTEIVTTAYSATKVATAEYFYSELLVRN